MSARPFPFSHSLSDAEAELLLASWPEPSMSESGTPRRWWMNTLRLVGVWVVLMLVCAHLALVLADDMPRVCDVGQSSSPRARGTPVTSAQTAVDGMSVLQKKMRDGYSAVFSPCMRRGGRA